MKPEFKYENFVEYFKTELEMKLKLEKLLEDSPFNYFKDHFKDEVLVLQLIMRFIEEEPDDAKLIERLMYRAQQTTTYAAEYILDHLSIILMLPRAKTNDD